MWDIKDIFVSEEGRGWVFTHSKREVQFST